MTDLSTRISRLIKGVPGEIAVLVKDQDGQTIFQTDNSKQKFKSASLIKLGIACYWEKQAVDLHQQERLAPQQLVPGGVLYHLAQRTWQLQDLLDLMLSVSDNSAANALIDLAGFDRVASWLDQHYQGIQLGRHLMARSAHDNLITACTAWQLFNQLLSDRSEFGQVCQRAMLNQATRSKLIANLPEGHSYNKTGELTDTEHDVARIFKRDRFYDCCFLSRFQSMAERKAIILAMNQVGELLYQSL